MELTRLCKSADSVGEDYCPAVYVAEIPTIMATQGKRLDEETAAQLLSLADDEVGNLLPTETLLRAAGLFMADHGHPTVSVEIETFLTGWLGEQR